MESVASGRDTLVVMPTGGGKSLCYQLPALALPGLTLVVSPLIALMKDQVDGLKGLGVAADCLHSGLSDEEQRAVLDRVRAGLLKMLFVAPERLRNAWFRASLSGVRIALAAVDEAHCVSEWGHDFRPDYLRIPNTLDFLGKPPVVALTATATPEVRQDIVRHLRMREPAVYMRGFDRPNLRYAVRRFRGDGDKDEHLVRYLKRAQGAGIVYAATRKAVDRVHAALEAAGVPCGKYHAGLPDEARADVQERWMEGHPRVIAATNAFGMGIDKADLRFVVHYNFPRSVEALSQETGRAGRDGLPADALLLFSAKDRYIQEFFIDNMNPDRSTIRRVYDLLKRLGSGRVEMSYADLARLAQSRELNDAKVSAAVKCLEDQGFVRRMDRGEKEALLLLPASREPLLSAMSSRSALRNKLALLLYRHKGNELRLPLQDLADRLECPRDALQREIHHLAGEGCLKYEAAFRGRGLLLPEEIRPFESFDMKRVEEKRAREVAKMEAVISYAYAERCRRKFILDYFADPSPRVCGNCDVCAGTGTSAGAAPERAANVRPAAAPARKASARASRERASSGRDTTPVEKATPAEAANPAQAVVLLLSGLRRNFGRGMAADLLRGSRKKDVMDRSLHLTKGYGALAHLSEATVHDLLDRLVRAKVLKEYGPRRFRLLKLSDDAFASGDGGGTPPPPVAPPDEETLF